MNKSAKRTDGRKAAGGGQLWRRALFTSSELARKLLAGIAVSLVRRETHPFSHSGLKLVRGKLK